MCHRRRCRCQMLISICLCACVCPLINSIWINKNPSELHWSACVRTMHTPQHCYGHINGNENCIPIKRYNMCVNSRTETSLIHSISTIHVIHIRWENKTNKWNQRKKKSIVLLLSLMQSLTLETRVCVCARALTSDQFVQILYNI